MKEAGTIAFAEKVLTLLELGLTSATYKYALLTTIIDLCLEQTTSSGNPPSTLTTRQLAEKVVQLYWGHAVPYEGGGVLRQGGVNAQQQAEIVRAIATFRGAHAGAKGELHFQAAIEHPAKFERLVRTVEWKLIEMPIPRLQVMGQEEERFLYEYGWDQRIRQGEVSAYQRGETGRFDNRLALQPGVAEQLIALSGVLRPVLRREWSLLVASMNDLPEARLDEHLFGSQRTSLEPVRSDLRELQDGRCFYCRERLGDKAEVDHFIPWARYADNALDNLVAAHPVCNNQKRDFFAAAVHLAEWLARSSRQDRDLAEIAARVSWARASERSRAVARVMYTRLPSGTKLWVKGIELVSLTTHEVEELF